MLCCACECADDGWVDTTETSAWDGFKKISEKLLNFSGESKKQVGLGLGAAIGYGVIGHQGVAKSQA